MGRGTSKVGATGGGGNVASQKDPALVKASAPGQLDGIRVQDLKVGDTITDRVFDDNGNGKRNKWTFHPEGQATFTEIPYSDLKITDVKVTPKTVKVTALFDKAVTKSRPQPSDFGKDFIEVTKTFKVGDITQKRIKNQ